MALAVTHPTVVITADDGTSEVGSNEWNAAHTLTGTLTSSQIDLTMSPTWTGTHTFSASVTASSIVSAVKYNVTSTTTASAVSIISSTSQTAAYTVTLPSSQGNASTFLQNNGSGVTSWATPTANIAPLTLTSTSIVEQRDSTVAQSFRVYNTTTSGTTDYERGVIDWATSANLLRVGTHYGGAGSARAVQIDAGVTAGGAGGTHLFLNAADIYFLSNNNTAAGNAVFWQNYLRMAVPISFASAVNAGEDISLTRVAANLLEVNNASAGGTAYVRLNGVAVASLPAASATYKGARGTVTDANSTTFLASVVAATSTSTAQIVPVFCDGTAWKIG